MGLLDAFTGGSAKKAAAENAMRLSQLKGEGMGYLDAGKTGALDALGQAGGIYGDFAKKYGAGTDLYLDSLGVNGAGGVANARGAYAPSLGLEYATNAAVDANDRRAASRGMLASGNTVNQTGDIAGKLAYQDYTGWQDRLAGLVNPEMAGVTGQAGTFTNQAGVYQNDANARVGLASGIATGLNNQNTQAANAAMQGSGNLWNFGLNLAKLGTGMLGGA